MSLGGGVKRDFVIEPITSPVLPFFSVRRHRTEDEVAVDKVVATVLSFAFLVASTAFG
jgi:hypothetical protein